MSCRTARALIYGRGTACFLGLCLLGSSLSVLLGAVPLSHSGPPTQGAAKKSKDGDLKTEDQAIEIGRGFYHKCWMFVPATRPHVSLVRLPRTGGAIYELDFAGDGRVSLDARSGQVTYFLNTRRPAERARGLVGDGPAKLANAIGAQVYLNQLVPKLGVPRECKLVELTCRFSGDRVDPPIVSASYQPMPYGYRLRNSFGRYGIAVDLADGAVLAYGRNPNWTYVIESHECRLTLGEARDKAQPFAKRYRLGPKPRRASDASLMGKERRSEAMFVRPNGEMGGIAADASESPARLRLAWVLFYGESDELWIDAADGRVLGGARRQVRHQAALTDETSGGTAFADRRATGDTARHRVSGSRWTE